MRDPTNSNVLDPFSGEHLEQLRTTYLRVLPLGAVWASTFVYDSWGRDFWAAITNGWVAATLLVSWIALRWSKHTLFILRASLWCAFVGFVAGLFAGYSGFGQGGSPLPGWFSGEHYNLAVMIIAAHTLQAPAVARLVSFYLWGAASLAVLGGLATSWYLQTTGPETGIQGARFVIAGLIPITLMNVFSRLGNLQLRSTVQNSLLQEYALTDALTKLPNRRAFQAVCERQFDPAQRGDRPMCLILVDIDRFKEINDAYGHEAGDRVLQQIAQVLRSVVRQGDHAVRWGGDEFAILLPDSNKNHGRLMAEKIRLTVESFPFDMGRVTVSLGIAQLSRDNSASSLFRRADQALYEAKHLGRNQVAGDPSAGKSTTSVELLRLALDSSSPTVVEDVGRAPTKIARSDRDAPE